MTISSWGEAKSTLKWEILDIEKALIVMLEVYILISLWFIVQEKKEPISRLRNFEMLYSLITLWKLNLTNFYENIQFRAVEMGNNDINIH